MIYSHWIKTLSLPMLLGLAVGLGAAIQTAMAAESSSPKASPAAVEDDMHEFMEYVFQPTYKRLKGAMAAEPADNNAWKGIKADSLILAEGGNLLLLRTPKDGATEWQDFSVAVRDLGGNFYRAAKKKDFSTAREHYQAMLKQCNACHDKFAGGEHQLAP